MTMKSNVIWLQSMENQGLSQSSEPGQTENNLPSESLENNNYSNNNNKIQKTKQNKQKPLVWDFYTSIKDKIMLFEVTSHIVICYVISGKLMDTVI